MGRNPFNNELEWAVLGKYLRVYDGERTYEGWGVRMHHDKYQYLTKHPRLAVSAA